MMSRGHGQPYISKSLVIGKLSTCYKHTFFSELIPPSSPIVIKIDVEGYECKVKIKSLSKVKATSVR